MRDDDRYEGSRVKNRAVTCVGIAAALAAASAPVATGAQPHCGDTLKHDTVLSHDLNCSQQTDGLEIGKDGVRVDLNGHAITTKGSDFAAVRIQGFDKVTVMDGELKGFSYGIFSSAGTEGTFTHLEIKGKNADESTGLYISDSTRGAGIERIRATNVAYGLFSSSSKHQIVDHFTVADSSHANTYGLYASSVSGKVTDLKADKVAYGLYANGETPGFEVSDSSADHASEYGFYFSNGTPFSLYQYILRGNTADNADEYGFYASSPAHGGHNRARHGGSGNCFNVPCS
jgi:hypothetical protein